MEYRQTSEIYNLDNNPRAIDEDGFEKLVKSIQSNPEHLEAKPLILSDRTGKLVCICGNQRLAVARHLGMKLIPTFLISGLTEEKERELILRDNVSAGEWDEGLLKDWDVSELAEYGLDIVPFHAEIPTYEEEEADREIDVICPYCTEMFTIKNSER